MQAWRVCAATGILCAMLLASPAALGQVLQLDINGIAVQARNAQGIAAFDGPFHTGSLYLEMDADASLAAALIDGAAAEIDGARLVALDGRIDLFEGLIIGGDLMMTVRDASDSEFIYSLLMSEQGGQFMPFSPYLLVGETENGLLSDAIFDVPAWHAAQPVAGALQMSNYSPDASGWSGNVQMEVFAQVVPEPATGLLVISAFMGLLQRRRGA